MSKNNFVSMLHNRIDHRYRINKLETCSMCKHYRGMIEHEKCGRDLFSTIATLLEDIPQEFRYFYANLSKDDDTRGQYLIGYSEWKMWVNEDIPCKSWESKSSWEFKSKQKERPDR